MRYFNISDGKNMLTLPKIAIGSDILGSPALPEKDAHILYDIYKDAGGTCIDTARMYADWLENGKNASETCVGNYIKSRNNRSELIISTKGGHPVLGQMDIGRLSKEDLTYDLDQSLKYLQTDYVDIYWLHRDDVSRETSDIMETLNSFIKDGKVRFIGVSNWHMSRIREANKYAAESRLHPLVSSQIQWSLAKSNNELFGDPTLVCMDETEYTQ